MDLSINKINATKKNDLTFKGLSGAYDEKSTPVFRFYAPPHAQNEKVTLEIAPLKQDKDTAQYFLENEKYIGKFDFTNDVCEIDQMKLRKRGSGFGYRYKITDNKGNTRYEVDPFRFTETSVGRMNVIEQGAMYGISPKGGTMRHSFLDSDVRIDPNTGKRADLNKEFVRNHFNKLGGSIAGLNWLLKDEDGKKELAPYRYFMTTPDIGADKVSSHRYWPSNHYQCKDLETFKDFNFELFKQGKGYIADGAFTSQGIQSPLLQHVLKWGEESPFYHMLKIDGRISLGVLPDVTETSGVNPYDHIGVRLVNPKGDNYDKNKPTYIQFYDNRLLDDIAQEDGEFHFDTNKVPDDHYDITTHQDSVQPYAFEIDPNDKKLSVFKKEGKNAILLKTLKDNYGGYQDFLTFPNFTIDTKTNVAGATCWDGNVDIIKMNLSAPKNNKADREGFFNARNYLLGVATYWTEAVQSHLILETAKASPENKAKFALVNEIPADRLKAIKNNLSNFNSLVLTQKKTAQDYVSQFPLQSLETSEELSAVFAQPQFQSEFLTEETQKELSDIINKVVKESIPEQYQSNGDYKLYVLKTYGTEILRHILAGALSNSAVDDEKGININELKKVTLKSLEKRYSESPKDERKQVISHIRKGIDIENTKAVSAKMKRELANISPEDFKLSEAIVLQGKGGLNWRFDAAKDIGDLNAVKNGDRSFNQIWYGDERTPGVQAFWTDFIKRIRTYNPSSYVINEITSLGEFGNWKKYESMLKFDPQLAEAWNKLSDDDKGNYDKGVIYQQQARYLNETNSTTTSEYSKGFNAFSIFAGVDPEHTMDVTGNQYQGVKAKAGKLDAIKKAMEGLTENNQPHPVIYDHMFVSNHDKPSILHTLPLNMSIYMASNLKDLNPKFQQQVMDITGRKDLDAINSKAAAVGIAMSEVIKNSDYSKEEKEKLQKALQDLVNGKKTPDSNPSFKRAESFGVKPYEITIKDMFKKAGMYEENNKKDEEAVLKFRHSLLKSSMTYFERMWQVMNACSGTPTIFGGSEFAQTGYETPSKNVYLGIRNEVLHDLKGHPLYKEYYNKISKTSSLYQDPQLSALRDGTPIYLPMSSTCNDAKETAKNTIKKLAEKTGMDEGKMDYFAKEAANFIQGERNNYPKKDGKYGPKSITEFFKEIKSGDEGFNHVVHDLFKISKEDGNPEAFKAHIDDVKKAIQAKLDLAKATASEVQIWPIYRYNDRGSEVLSVVTSLGLPQGKASWEVNAQKTITHHEVASILIKDKDGKCPFENGTILKRHGDKASTYIVKDGEVKNTTGGNIVLDNTVVTFYKHKENLVKYRTH